MTVRRSLTAALAGVMALMLSACAGLPTSGSVYAGHDLEEQIGPPDLSRLPDLPQPGADPVQIVNGFLRAGSGPGAALDWKTAGAFLAPALQETWDPKASVTIDVQSARVVTEPKEGAVVLALDPVATVDASGIYKPGSGDTSIEFTLKKQDNGEWRITEAPDGIVLDQSSFTTVYNRYALMFFDPQWRYLVPDLRWFPRVNVATSIAEKLVEGPAPWLKDSVATAFTDNVSLALPSVPVTSGIADVSLNRDARALDARTLDRMQTQLAASLAARGVTEVRMSADDVPLEADVLSTRSTAVAASPLVLTEAEFGFLTGDDLEPIPGLSETIMKEAPSAVAVQVAPDRDFAAVRLESGEVLRVAADGEAIKIDERPGLVDPAVDLFGFTWSVPRDDPAGLAVFNTVGQRVELAGQWGDASHIPAISVSRDGTRIAAIVTNGTRSATWVAGIVRHDDGVPIGLGEPVQLGGSVNDGVGLTWLDSVTVGVLASSGDDRGVTEQPIGGPTSPVRKAPEGVNGIAGANQTTAVRLHSENGSVYVRQGSNWQKLADGIRVLATQQGSPQ